MENQAIKELIFRMADNALIFGHRNSEWTGLGPIIEEDLAFSSMAQDKIGHALALYSILHEEFGEASPNELAFLRDEKEFKCCHLVELHNGEYDFSLARQFYFDYAEMLRYEMLESSSYKPLSDLARRVKGELKYHIMHAQTWMQSLGNGTEESRSRMQTSLDELMPYAIGIFESGNFEKELAEAAIFGGENNLKTSWLQTIEPVLKASNLQLPDPTKTEAKNGGRQGFHTENLQPLLSEMGEVLRMQPSAEW